METGIIQGTIGTNAPHLTKGHGFLSGNTPNPKPRTYLRHIPNYQTYPYVHSSTLSGPSVTLVLTIALMKCKKVAEVSNIQTRILGMSVRLPNAIVGIPIDDIVPRLSLCVLPMYEC